MLQFFSPGYNSTGPGFDLDPNPPLQVNSPAIWSYRGFWPFQGVGLRFTASQANTQGISAPSPVASPQMRLENPLPWWQNKKDV